MNCIPSRVAQLVKQLRSPARQMSRGHAISQFPRALHPSHTARPALSSRRLGHLEPPISQARHLPPSNSCQLISLWKMGEKLQIIHRHKRSGGALWRHLRATHLAGEWQFARRLRAKTRELISWLLGRRGNFHLGGRRARSAGQTIDIWRGAKSAHCLQLTCNWRREKGAREE